MQLAARAEGQISPDVEAATSQTEAHDRFVGEDLTASIHLAAATVARAPRQRTGQNQKTRCPPQSWEMLPPG